MKKIFLLIFVLIPLLATAKEKKVDSYSKQVQCFPTETLLYAMENQFKESVVFFYTNKITQGKTQIVMFSSRETGTWTLIEMNKSLGCVLAAGQNTLS